MKRSLVVLIACAVVTIGVLYSNQHTSCPGSFQFRYTRIIDSLTPTTDEQCRRAFAQILDLESFAAALGQSPRGLRSRLDVDLSPTDAGLPSCRVTYAGPDAARTTLALDTLVQRLAQSLAREGERRRQEQIELAHAMRSEAVERRGGAQDERASSPPGDRRLSADVEGWSDEEYRIALEKFDHLIEQLRAPAAQTACAEFLDRTGARSPEALESLRTTCAAARPVGITSWPELGRDCAARAERR